MPVINIEYDAEKVTVEDMRTLCEGAHEVVSTVTKIEDVPVYAHNADVKVEVAPIEIFVRLSSHKIHNADTLATELKQALSEWKKAKDFKHPINMSLIPMEWKIEIGI